jgi:hypothetical protein
MSGAGTDTIIGSGSLMPIDAYLKKIEFTKIYESPDQTDDYQRSILKDLRPDKPFFESDQPRNGKDPYTNETRGGNQSRSRIALRETGSRSYAEPSLPDGTFLDWQFLEKDQRGVALEPDMRKHVEQQKARGKFYNYRNDSDNSIPESGWHPYKAQMQIRNAQHQTKEKLKIFDTAFDGWTTGGKYSRGTMISNVDMQETDNEVPDLAGAEHRNRADITNNLSNDTSIGWRRTTDHKFKVAKYGQQRGGKAKADDEWYKNRANANLDHDIGVSYQDSNMDKSTALKIIDIAGQRKNANLSALHTKFDRSMNSQTGRQHKVISDDIAGSQIINTEESGASTANSLLKNAMTNKSGERLEIKTEQKLGKSIINPIIFDFMTNTNKRMADAEIKNLRDKIEQTAIKSGIYIEEQNSTKLTEPASNSLMWQSHHNQTKGDDKKVFQYKAPVKSNLSNNITNIDGEDYKSQSYQGNQRKINNDPIEIQNIDSTEYDGSIGRDDSVTKLVGPVGTKYMQKYHERDHVQNNINDMG